MKKILYSLITIAFIVACSASDDSNTDQQPNANGEYSLIINGVGYDNYRVELFNDTINSVGGSVLFAASDDFDNALSVYVPSSGESSNTIIEYDTSITEPFLIQANTAGFSTGNNTFRSENGTFTIEEFVFNENENCAVWRGNLDIDFTLNGQGGDVLNVQGTFEIFSQGCDTDN